MTILSRREANPRCSTIEVISFLAIQVTASESQPVCLQEQNSPYSTQMIRRVVPYGHPALRQKGERVETITPAISALIGDLLETMYNAHGIGLAAQQIGEAVQVTVVDVRTVERPSNLELNGKPANVDEFMPLVLINPEIRPFGESVAGSEGCLSFPEVYAEIKRPETVDVVALNDKGQRIEFRCGGVLARAIQHEVDHLNGILFIDRMDVQTKGELKPTLADLQARTKAALQNEIAARAG
jgi:peptide deformylase